MKVDSIKIGATIPTQSYGNIQPEIILSDVPLQEGIDTGMKFISGLFEKYSEKGGLVPKEVIKASGIKKSFNEDVEIEFEPIGHTYAYKGKALQGVTDYIKKFYKPFDAETISSVLESKWGIPAQVIRDMWKEGGIVTSEFGTVVHKTLEYFEKFKSYGEVVSSQQKEELNYCLPKHPILRDIVLGFMAIDNAGGTIVTEALVSNVETGICGHADRIKILDEKKKICRVQDYKVNIESEEIDKKYKVLAPFDKMPANKITKYQLQLSIYANLLQKSGWKVEGLDVFVYEKEWKHFPLEVLQVI